MCISGALEGAGVGARLRISPRTPWATLGPVLLCPDLAAVARGDQGGPGSQDQLMDVLSCAG